MVDRCQHHVVSYQRTITDRDAALILKMTAGINKDIFPYCNILTKVCIKGWEQTEVIFQFFSGQPPHHLPDFLWRMIVIIQFHANAYRFLTKLTEDTLPLWILCASAFFSPKFFQYVF